MRRDTLRALMHIEKRADAVPGAVSVVQTGVPHQGARHRVQRRPAGAFGKLLPRQLDVAAQHQRVQPALAVGARAHHDRARVVSRAAHHLGSGVHQEQVPVVKEDLVAGLAIVHDRAVRAGGGDGGEAQIAEPILAGILFVQHFRIRPLAHALAGAEQLLETGQAANLRRRGMHVSPPHAGDLGLVFLRLHGHHRVAALADTCRLRQQQSRAHGRTVGVEPDRLSGCHLQPPHRLRVRLVSLEIHIRREFLPQRRGRRRTGEAGGALAIDDQIGLEHRIVINVAAPQIGDPGDLVQLGDDHRAGLGLGHLPANGRQLVADRTARHVVGQRIDRLRRRLRPVIPHLVNQVGVDRHQGRAGCRQGRGVGGMGCHGVQERIEANPQGSVLLFHFRQPALQGMGVGQSHLVDAKAGGIDFLLGLQVVARVHEQVVAVRRQQYVPRRPGKAADGGAAALVGRHVFVQVGIGRGNQIGVHPVFGQSFIYPLKPLGEPVGSVGHVRTCS